LLHTEPCKNFRDKRLFIILGGATMTGLVRKATLLGACGLFCAASALANVPAPDKSCAPAYILVVGRTSGGAATDPAGLSSVTVRDAFNNPIAGATVTIDFSGCCDINLCPTGVGHNCAARTVSGLTNASGVYSFTVLGAAKDPGNLVPPAQYGGCGHNGVHIYANAGTGNVELVDRGPSCTAGTGLPPTGVTLDLNGAAGGSNGTSGSDVSNEINLFGSISGGAPYKGRGDINLDGVISGADVSAEISHFGRLSGIGGVGCTDGAGVPQAFCAKPACP
jgi:hypothetical protein